MSQIIGNLFQCPASLACPMSKVMAQIMEREVSNLLPLVLACSLFECSKPMMNARFRQSLVALGGEDVRTFRIATAMLKILKERSPALIKQVNLPKFASL